MSNLKFDGWPWKTIRPLFCTTSIFVHPFKLIGEFKLELQSRNTQFGAKLAFLCSVWPWNLMHDLEKQWGTSSILRQALCIISKPSVDSNWSYNTEIRSLGQNWRFFVPCGLEIWQMTLKYNRATLLLYFKLCTSFRSHWWIQTGVTIRKCPIWVKKMMIVLDLWPRNLTIDIENNRIPLSWPYVNSNCNLVRNRLNWVLTSVNLTFDLFFTLNFCMDIMIVNGKGYCKFHDDTMTGTLSRWYDGRTGRQTDGKKCS